MPRKRQPPVFDYVPERSRPRLSHPTSKRYRDTLMRGLLSEIEVGSSVTKLYATLLAKEMLGVPAVNRRYRDELEQVLRREGLAIDRRLPAMGPRGKNMRAKYRVANFDDIDYRGLVESCGCTFERLERGDPAGPWDLYVVGKPPDLDRLSANLDLEPDELTPA